MARKTASARTTATYVEWYTISIYWIVFLVLVILGAGGFWVYYRWFRPNIQETKPQQVTEFTQQYAVFAELRGKVEIKHKDDYVYRNADYRQQLINGDLIRTGPDGTAEVQCPDGTQLEVPPDSLVRVECHADPTDRRLAEIQRGSLEAEVSTRRQEGLVRTPNNTEIILHQRSRAQIRYEELSKETLVAMEKGSGRVRRGNEEVNIQEREGARVGTQGPIEKTRLPDPPRLIRPANRSQIPAQAGEATSVILEWSGVPNATAYELQVSNRQDMSRFMRRVLTETSVELVIPNRLQNLWYHWRVRARDDKGFYSPYSEKWVFAIGKRLGVQQEACDLQIDGEPFGQFVILNGKTSPSCSLSIAGESVVVQPNGRFRYVYTIRQPGVTREPIVLESLYGVSRTWTMEIRVAEVTEIRFYPQGGG